MVFTCFVGLLGCMSGLHATNGDQDPPYPQAEARPAAVDMGEVVQGSLLRGSFSIKNTGGKPLLIAQVRSSCGVMIPAWPRDPIAPGDSATIGFRYDTGRKGPFHRLITIHTNARQKTLVVEVRGIVR